MEKILGKLKIPCILLSLLIMLTSFAGTIQYTLADPDISAGSISGLIWIDDGDGDKPPLAGYTAYLYTADDLTSAVTSMQTDVNGIYIFEDIEPGNYVLGIAADTINGTEYRLSAYITAHNKFKTDNDDSMMAYTDIIELAEGQAVQNIDAGMQPIIWEIEVIEQPDESEEFEESCETAEEYEESEDTMDVIDETPIVDETTGSEETYYPEEPIYPEEPSYPESTPEPIFELGSISGLLWADGGWQLLDGYTVYLYAADNLLSAIAITQTDSNGVYIFENLVSGAYVIGIDSYAADGNEYLLPTELTYDCRFAIDWYSNPLMAYTEVIALEAGQALKGINAGLTSISNGPSRAPTPEGNSYTIDVNDYFGSLTVPGVGYTYNIGTNILVFDANANGNSYTITRSAAGPGNLMGIDFLAGSSPASVTMVGLNMLTKGITLTSDFSSDLSFRRYNGEYCDLRTTTFTLPTGYKGNLDINGLKLDTLIFPSDYDLPITFNGFEASNIVYPTNYNLPITIGGAFKVPQSKQFPVPYAGPIIIGDSNGAFDIQQAICRTGTNIGFDAGIFIPGNISTLTINNAKTSGSSGHLAIKLGAADNFTLFVSGSSDINGYIEVPSSAHLTIDSADNPGVHSENGRLAITTDANTAIGSPVTINGGMIEATGSSAGIGGGSGQVTINGGKVAATCTGTGAAIGSSSSGGYDTVAHITINAGTVIASALGDGAGIGSGSGATGGLPNNTISVGAVILITGGTIEANGGDVERIYFGSGSYSGAGIGGGKGACADITITGGYVTANSMHGAGIGNGSGGTYAVRGSVVITGGVIRGYTMNGRSIGMGDSYGWYPTYFINKEANILMHRRGHVNDTGGILGSCDNPVGNLGATDYHGDGHFVNIYFAEEYVNGDIYVYEADTMAFVRLLPIQKQHPYAGILFSTGHSYSEDFKIFVDTEDPFGVSQGMKQVIHYYDHLPPLSGGGPSTYQLKLDRIPSVTHMNSYLHNFDNSSWHTLYCYLDLGGPDDTYYQLKEIFVDINGNPIPGNGNNVSTIKKGSQYGGPSGTILGYDYMGYKQDLWDGTYTPGNLSIPSVNGDISVYYVYKIDPGVANVTVSKEVTGSFIDRSKDFVFTVYIKDADNQPITGTILYEGGTIPSIGTIPHADGAFNLDQYGTDTFTLKHGQSIKILNLPGDAEIMIVETTDNDYYQSFIDSSGESGTNDTGYRVVSVDGASERTFAFVNAQKVPTVPTGIAYDLFGTVVLPLIAVMLLLSGWITVSLTLKRLSATKANTKAR